MIILLPLRTQQIMILNLKVDRESYIKSLNQGDERAFEELFRMFYPSLCFFAKRFLQGSNLAEEVAQDCLHKAWQRRSHFKSFDAFKAFLYISAKNACLDKLDQQTRKNHREHRYFLDQPTIESAIDQEIIYTEVLSEISNAIGKLPEQCQKIIRLLYEDGKKAKEIADELQISISTVNNQKSRGIALLKDKLGKDSYSLFFLLVSIDMLTSF